MSKSEFQQFFFSISLNFFFPFSSNAAKTISINGNSGLKTIKSRRALSKFDISCLHAQDLIAVRKAACMFSTASTDRET